MDAETHNIPSCRKKRKGFPGEIRWLGGMGLYATRIIAQTFLAVAFNARLVCIIVFDCM